MPIIERSRVIEEARGANVFKKAGAIVANDFAGQCAVGDLAVDTVTPKLWQCSVTNGSTTATWVGVGAQV